MHKNYDIAVFKTPLGWGGVAATGRGISRVVLPKKDKKSVERELESSELRAWSEGNTSGGMQVLLKKSMLILQKYFSGERVPFDLPLDLRYYTRFQQSVWKAAAGIPYGGTRSYAWVAKRIRRPRAARAVGQAMGANPVPIIIP
jgi:methylated-DNA-[protein]-cysteine S-methyltransferase